MKGGGYTLIVVLMAVHNSTIATVLEFKGVQILLSGETNVYTLQKLPLLSLVSINIVERTRRGCTCKNTITLKLRLFEILMTVKLRERVCTFFSPFSGEQVEF